MRIDVGRRLALNAGIRIGVVLLSHQHLHRTAQLALFLAQHGAVVAIHVDAKSDRGSYDQLVHAVGTTGQIFLCERTYCEWGMFSLTQAALSAAEALLKRWPNLSHVCQISGDTLPIRSLVDFEQYIASHPQTDFIECVAAARTNWVKGGLGIERFQFWFPVAWRRRRRLFDFLVKVQRRFAVSRSIPDGISPYLGSQWWCLTTQTLKAILQDPQRDEYAKYFRWCWIPDESYFQSLVSKHATNIESRSIVMSKFDQLGRPYIYYDDHAEMLAQSGEYFVRKIWHDSPHLYEKFLPDFVAQAEPATNLLDESIRNVEFQRKSGRRGLVMQSRFPQAREEDGVDTARPYDVFCGFENIVTNFPAWLNSTLEAQIHGRLFGPTKVEFSGGKSVSVGCQLDDKVIRDVDPRQFLRNLLWSQRDRRQAFLFAATDSSTLVEYLISDQNCNLYVLVGGWAFIQDAVENPGSIHKKQALLARQAERRLINLAKSRRKRANVQFWHVDDHSADPERLINELLGVLSPQIVGRIAIAPEYISSSQIAKKMSKLRDLGLPLLAPADLSAMRTTGVPRNSGM